MKTFKILTSMSSLILLGILFLSKAPTTLFSSASTIMNTQTANCNRNPIKTSLRIWLDPIPRSPAGYGALPPGVEQPAPEPQGPETHALNLELFLENTSEEQQSVRVLNWRWRQGGQTQLVSWNNPPDMSPLNRYNQVQRHLVKLNETETVSVEMDLGINGQQCQLKVQQQP